MWQTSGTRRQGAHDDDELFVGNLSFDVTQGDVREAFAAYGPVSSANIVTDRSDGTSKGFGFVEMLWQAHAMAAIEGLNGTDLKGRTINAAVPVRTAIVAVGEVRPRGWDVVGPGRHRW